MSENSDTDMQAVTQEAGTVVFPNGVQYFANKRGVDLIFIDEDGDVFTQTGDEPWKVVGESPAATTLTTIK